MIRTDRKIIAAVLKLANSYHDEMVLGHDPCSLLLVQNISDVVKQVTLSVSKDDAEESVKRLIDSGLLRIETKWMGGYSFCMTSLLKHRHAFWWDSFSKKYIAGFISGVATTVAAGVIAHFITDLF